MDVRASPAEKIYQHHVNAWRRERFTRFAFRPGQPLPPAVRSPNGIVKNYLQAFFETPAEADQERRAVHLAWQRQQPGYSLYGHSTQDMIVPTIISVPGFHRPQMVPPGSGECYDCDGTGWLLHVPNDEGRDTHVLAECPCPACGGTGSWRQAEIRSGYSDQSFHRIPPGFRGPDPGSPMPNTTPYHAHLRRNSSQAQPARRRRGAPGLLRTAAGGTLFLVMVNPVAQPIWAVTHQALITTVLAAVISALIATVVTRLVFGPLRDNQVLGPLWFFVAPLYGVFGVVLLIATLSGLEFLGKLASGVFESALSAREALSRIPLGR